MKKRTAIIYALGHFLVDFSCAYLLLSGQPQPWLYVIYNFCAFALQMPIGLLADMVGRNRLFAVLGSILAFTAYLPFPVAVRVLLAGVGNACYHVGGGREALLSDKKLVGLGLFVSPGAIGILLGTLYAGFGSLDTVTAPALLLLMISILLLCSNQKALIPPGKAYWRNGFLMFLVVLARSFVGMCMLSPWKTGVFIICAGIASAAGKFLGGWLSDRLGSKRIGVASLLISACLFCVPGSGVAGVLGCLFFNMTMPITLKNAADSLPGYEGFSFGLLTFALFLGYLPTLLSFTVSPWIGAGICIISAGLLLLSREKYHD